MVYRLRRPADDDSRFLRPIDSAAMLGALVKGRSSSKQINARCRKVAVCSFCGGHDPFYVWVPSDDNPADAPSRLFEVEKCEKSGDESEQPQSRHSIVDFRDSGLRVFHTSMQWKWTSSMG